MTTYDLRGTDRDEFVIHFGGRPAQVNAFTFANSLLGWSEALREINAAINPDYKIEVVVDAVGSGCFRTRLRTTRKNLPSLIKSGFVNVILPVALWFVTDRIFDDDEITIIANEDHYVVERGDDIIILPKEAYLARDLIKNPTPIEQHLSNAFEAMDQDDSVTDFQVLRGIEDETPIVKFDRSDFARLAAPPEIVRDDETIRINHERVDLTVIRVILRRSRRRWQFVYRGFEISAPITYPSFYDRVERQQISFHKGTILDSCLKITQVKDPETGVFINDPNGYEVVEVFDVVDGPRQQEMLPE